MKDRDDIREFISTHLENILSNENELTVHRLRAAELMGLVWGLTEDTGELD